MRSERPAHRLGLAPSDEHATHATRRGGVIAGVVPLRPRDGKSLVVGQRLPENSSSFRRSPGLRSLSRRPYNTQRGASPGRVSRLCSRAKPGGRKRDCRSERSRMRSERPAHRLGLAPSARVIGLASPRAPASPDWPHPAFPSTTTSMPPVSTRYTQPCSRGQPCCFCNRFTTAYCSRWRICSRTFSVTSSSIFCSCVRFC
jgi:hypothetical protein